MGEDETPVVDTWWQTETGAAMISPIPGITVCKPGSAMRTLPGISAKIVDDDGKELAPMPDHAEPVTGYPERSTFPTPSDTISPVCPSTIWYSPPT